MSWAFGINAVPPELFEYATLESRSAWQRFWAVTVPLLLCIGVFRITDLMYRRNIRKQLIETLTFSSGFKFKPGGYFKAADLATKLAQVAGFAPPAALRS